MTYTGWIPVKVEKEDEVLDIPSMAKMDIDAYSAYIKDHLLFMDHHDALRSNMGQYPFATSRAQIDSFIEVLRDYQSRMP